MIYEDDSHYRYCLEIEGGNISRFPKFLTLMDILTEGLLDYQDSLEYIVNDFMAGLDKMIKEIEKSYDKYIKEVILNETKTNKRK